MLQLTPELIRILRISQAKAEARIREQVSIHQNGRQLNRGRLVSMAERAVDVLRSGAPTMFANEAHCRHGFRVALIFQGWNWSDADNAAAEIVAAAFKLMGAKRPSWIQGQPEWRDRDATHWRLRHCLTCSGVLDEDQPGRHCSRECASVTAKKTWAALNKVKMAALTKAWGIANPEKRKASARRYVERSDPRSCKYCGSTFQVANCKKTEFCQPSCHYAWRRQQHFDANAIPCDQCGTMFVGRTGRVRKNRYCSQTCSNGARRAKLQASSLICEAAE